MTETPGTHSSADGAVRTVSPSATRRRFLLGAGAVLPSVYTLSSGAQTAATSLLCTQKPMTSTPTRIASPDDQWYRDMVASGKTTGNQMAYCIMDKQSSCVDGLQPTWSADGSVWIANGQRQLVARGDIKHIGSYGQSYGLVYVDQTGSIATLDPNGRAGLTYVFDSCAASLGVKSTSLG
jgi:hypothetical protein